MCSLKLLEWIVTLKSEMSFLKFENWAIQSFSKRFNFHSLEWESTLKNLENVIEKYRFLCLKISLSRLIRNLIPRHSILILRLTNSCSSKRSIRRKQRLRTRCHVRMQKLAHKRAHSRIDSLEGVIRLLCVVVIVVVDHAAVCRQWDARTVLFLPYARNFVFRIDYICWIISSAPVVN